LTWPPSRLRPRIIRALIHRDYQINRSYRLSLALDFLFGFLNIVIYYFISETFEDTKTSDLEGAPSYFAFAAVGIIMTVVVQVASTALARRVREEQLTGTLEALVAQPISAAELALGMAGFPFLFAMIRVAAYLVIANLVLGLELSQASVPGCVLVLVASAAAVAALGIALGALVLVLKRGEALVRLATFSIAFLSGAFFPIAVLPDWLQPLGEIIPTRFALDGVRAALFVGEGWGDDVLALVLTSVLAVPVALWVFGRGLAWTIRQGSLSQY
jgi:ABC-2 type transport system permease protein